MSLGIKSSTTPVDPANSGYSDDIQSTATNPNSVGDTIQSEDSSFCGSIFNTLLTPIVSFLIAVFHKFTFEAFLPVEARAEQNPSESMDPQPVVDEDLSDEFELFPAIPTGAEAAESELDSNSLFVDSSVNFDSLEQSSIDTTSVEPRGEAKDSPSVSTSSEAKIPAGITELFHNASDSDSESMDPQSVVDEDLSDEFELFHNASDSDSESMDPQSVVGEDPAIPGGISPPNHVKKEDGLLVLPRGTTKVVSINDGAKKSKLTVRSTNRELLSDYDSVPSALARNDGAKKSKLTVRSTNRELLSDDDSVSSALARIANEDLSDVENSDDPSDTPFCINPRQYPSARNTPL